MNDWDTGERTSECYGCGGYGLNLTFHDCKNGWWAGAEDWDNPEYSVGGRKL